MSLVASNLKTSRFSKEATWRGLMCDYVLEIKYILKTARNIWLQKFKQSTKYSIDLHSVLNFFTWKHQNILYTW